MPSVKNKKPAAQLPHFYWRRLDGAFLLTNDFGGHAWLTPGQFRDYKAGKLGARAAAAAGLEDKGFLRDRLNMDRLYAGWRSSNAYLGTGPGLHILVLTLRCNHRCTYCQAGAAGAEARGTDMSWAVAKKSVDFAFASSSSSVSIEFQGGEPLLNWPVLEKAVRYARSREKSSGKTLSLSVVSNLSLMTETKASFLLRNEVSVCTSLDGPAGLHNANRPLTGADSHATAVKWIKYFGGRYSGQGAGYRVFKPSALLTVTRRSLAMPEKIVDEYARLGLDGIFLRPVSPIGFARDNWKEIGYTPEEFSRFYARALAHILKLNRRGVAIREKFASMLLGKILAMRDHGYVDLRCPCGAGLGQVAYDHKGDIYTCDEGRMIAWQGDDLFRIGNVAKDRPEKVLAGPVVKACAAASSTHSQPECSRCAYSPFCGVCPAYNYSAQGSLWGSMPENERCRTLKGIFAVLFQALRRGGDAKILGGWVGK